MRGVDPGGHVFATDHTRRLSDWQSSGACEATSANAATGVWK
jgi:hypothetical protein